MEIDVLVEGTDELAGADIQILHSNIAAPANKINNIHHHHDNNNNDDPDDDNHTQGDVLWNPAFVNCILQNHLNHNYNGEDKVDNKEGGSNHSPRYQHLVYTVDFEQFHDTVPVPRDCSASPCVPY